MGARKITAPDARTMLTTAELAARWKCHLNTAKKLVRTGQVPSMKVGHLRRIPLAAIEAIERCDPSRGAS